MPIITIQAIEGVVLTSKEQKQELLKKMTDTFIEVVGEVARPYTYCVIQETPVGEWSIAGVPLPDLPFLYGPEYSEMHAKANEIMRSYVAQMEQAHEDEEAEKRARAEEQWAD
ncbi:MAG: tautomerase family protein [Candidatus Promineifilaceae bacterium]|jgi:4-oxalocrotonate tautomerase